MPQVLKEELRDRILDAARAVFAEQGYLGATMSVIAARAGLAAGSLYRYYASKERLFEAAIPPDLAREFEAILGKRVRALGAARERGEHDSADEMLQFWIANRLAVVVLLDRAEGTPYARFGEDFVDRLVALTLEQIRAARPGLRVDAPARFVLRRIFENTRRMLASILAAHTEESAIRGAIEAFWSYQIAGLRAFARHVSIIEP